jgi:ATP-dependent Clp protease ATP-binding subunit ClpC
VLERFSHQAREVVYLATREASEVGQDCAGVEHVLLGLVAEQDGLAGRVLRSFGVTVQRVHAQLLEIGPASAQGASSQGPFPLAFTPQAGGCWSWRFARR